MRKPHFIEIVRKIRNYILLIFPASRWKNGTCKLNRGCSFAHGEKELTAWNEHLEKMEKEMKKKTDEKKEKAIDGRLKSSSNKVL